jgi:hypothetical protein
MPTNPYQTRSTVDGEAELDPNNPIGAARIFSRNLSRDFQGFVQGINRSFEASVQSVERAGRDFDRSIRGEKLLPPQVLDPRDAGVFPPLVKDLSFRSNAPLSVPVQASLSGNNSSPHIAPSIVSRTPLPPFVDRCIAGGGGLACGSASYSAAISSAKNGGNSAIAECLKYGGGKACYSRR